MPDRAAQRKQLTAQVANVLVARRRKRKGKGITGSTFNKRSPRPGSDISWGA